MSPTLGEWILGSIVLSFFAAGIGAVVARHSKVDINVCEERRGACNKIVDEKIEALNLRVTCMYEKLEEIYNLLLRLNVKEPKNSR